MGGGREGGGDNSGSKHYFVFKAFLLLSPVSTYTSSTRNFIYPYFYTPIFPFTHDPIVCFPFTY